MKLLLAAALASSPLLSQQPDAGPKTGTAVPPATTGAPVPGSARSPLAEALENFDIVTGKFPADPKVLFQLTAHLANSGRTGEATIALARLEKNPGPIAKSEIGYLRYQVEFALRNFEKALGTARGLRQADPESFRLWFSEAQCLFLLYRFEEAQKVMAELVKKYPKGPRLPNGRFDSTFSNLLDFQRYTCLVRLGKGESPLAKSLVDRFNYLSQDPIWYARNAVTEFEKGNSAEGLRWMQSIEQIYPPQVSSLYLDCFYELGYLPHWKYPDRAPFDAESLTGSKDASGG